MLNYNDQINKIVDKYADLGIANILNVAGYGINNSINRRMRQAAKDRIYVLINKRVSSPYNKEFTKQENRIIYQLVTKTLLHLTYFK